MNVAYLINQYPQPSQTFIRREIAALEAAGTTVQRFTLRRSVSTLVDPADQSERARTRVILDEGPIRLLSAVAAAIVSRPRRFLDALKLTWELSLASSRGKFAHIAYLVEACVLRKWLAESEATHLHAHFGTNSTAVATICRKLGGPPYSFTVHGPEEFDQPMGLSLATKTENSEFAVTISAFGRSQLCRWCEPSIWPRIEIVRCGVDEAFLDLPLDSAVTNDLKFVCVGRLEPQKGQFILLEAAAKLLSSGVSIKIMLIGDGSMRPQLERRISELGIAQSVHLAGWMSGAQIRHEILASRAMVLPSFAEGLPVVLMEALALGRPVIATWIAGIPELVQPSCGWLVPPGDVDALAETLSLACKTPSQRLKEMGEDGRKRVMRDHDSKTEASKLLHLFANPRA